MYYIYSAIIGYLFGCIQSSYLIGRLFFKKNIKELGNGNAGGSNALVVFGKKVGFTVIVLDALKVVLASLVVSLILPSEFYVTHKMSLVYIVGLAAIGGHNFPFYMKFKGGKGTAALLGMVLAIDVKLFFAALLALILVTLISDYIVVGTAGLLLTFLIYTIIYVREQVPLAIAIFICVMSVYKHRENIPRILNGTEKKVRASLLKKK